MKISTLRCEFGRDRFHVADIVVMRMDRQQMEQEISLG